MTRIAVSYRGPDSLWLVRHGQSTGNVANDEARRTGAELLDLERDAAREVVRDAPARPPADPGPTSRSGCAPC
ncbi:MAG: phosphoglycerate mutase family protein [Pseudonocardiaceae bacterium]|nr:MAG: phosphoglycerate mutase family protein [Pseudonocardiaceae bacterium]